MDLKEFGLYFAKLREESGYKSQRQFALASKISNGTIARIEAGTQRATPETLITLASYLKGNPYISLLINIGYLDMLSDELRNQLILVEKYKSLIIVLQSALNFFKESGDMPTKILDLVLSSTQSHEIPLDIVEFKKDPISSTRKLLLTIGLGNLDLLNTSSPIEIDEIKSLSDILGKSFDIKEQSRVMDVEEGSLQTELEEEILGRDDIYYHNDGLSSTELNDINKLIRAALVTKVSGKASSELRTYLSKFNNPLYEKKPDVHKLAVLEGAGEYAAISPERKILMDLVSKIPDEDLEDFKILAKRFIKEK